MYILKCVDESLYTGCTNDLEKRVREHNNSKSRGARYTKTRRPVVLMYSEEYETIGEALKREAKIKTFTRERKFRLLTGAK